MDDISEALAALTDREPDRRDVAADTLGDILRSSGPSADTARMIVGRLVSVAIDEPVTKIRESALNAISEAVDHHRLPLDLVALLTAAMPTMEPELLEHALYILGATHAPQASQLIEPFLHHPDPQVRKEAQLAAGEITAADPEGLTRMSTK
ncbi:hypothetical protein PV396_27610 [Streptomyces sp. ME02-8801-2C]|uniref:hypothetical protein n=1 Tax=Streptomyces sp. ME02-8801-2C TaxID=3028680 RepID=UPI0029A0FA51|nr:hypothetical protein [Streptomyces sp. ME02-8801-2C]MDX3455661.1 hypothetical protein [Streptomyces sp. ME02-8801-2C]